MEIFHFQWCKMKYAGQRYAVAWEMDVVHVDQTRPRGGIGERRRITARITLNIRKYSTFNKEAYRRNNEINLRDKNKPCRKQKLRRNASLRTIILWNFASLDLRCFIKKLNSSSPKLSLNKKTLFSSSHHLCKEKKKPARKTSFLRGKFFHLMQNFPPKRIKSFLGVNDER